MTGLTTHVLDTYLGIPAEGVQVEFVEITKEGTAIPVSNVKTGKGGRCELATQLKKAEYEIRFHVGDYFRTCNTPTADPPFLNIVPVRFTVADPARHYHIPLVASPWSYSTYKGGAPAAH